MKAKLSGKDVHHYVDGASLRRCRWRIGTLSGRIPDLLQFVSIENISSVSLGGNLKVERLTDMSQAKSNTPLGSERRSRIQNAISNE